MTLKEIEYNSGEVTQHFQQIAQLVLAVEKTFFSFWLLHVVVTCSAAATVV